MHDSRGWSRCGERRRKQGTAINDAWANVKSGDAYARRVNREMQIIFNVRELSLIAVGVDVRERDVV
jgi:hypothetical protein